MLVSIRMIAYTPSIPFIPSTRPTMPLWDKLRTELDRAGKAAQNAVDEGKLRLEAMRARQFADKAAQALGYAIHRDTVGLQSLDAETRQRLVKAISDRLDEVAKLEDKLKGGAPEGTPEPPPDPGNAPSA